MAASGDDAEMGATEGQIKSGEPAQPVRCTGDDGDWPSIHGVLSLQIW
jgi:hypothetical protein